MKKKTIIVLLILTLSIYALNINVQSAEENDYSPTLLELTPHDPISITSDSDFEVFPGLGTAEDPYIIEGYNITTTSQSGIYIYGTTKYFIIRNCYVDAENNGIYIDDVADGTATVINNTCSNNTGYGIALGSSGNSTVANNMCNNNNRGIELGGYSSSSTVTNNTCSNNNDRGIYIYTPDNFTIADNTCENNNDAGIFLYYSDYSTVVNNMCNNNGREGIRFDFSGSSTVTNNMCSNNNDEGVRLSDSDSSTVTNNTCSNNNNYGIYLYYSASCVVTYNLLQENEEYGVYLKYDSDNNLIHHNNFVDNNLGGTSQAYDVCTNNTWYDIVTSEGNYWSDWSGTGNYTIDGDSNSVDLYPLDEPAEYSVESTTDENQLDFTFTILMLIVPLILTRIISKKVKK